MDASRTRLEFLYEVIEAAIDNGATVINIPDTVGYATPIEFGELIQKIRKNVRNIDKAIISVIVTTTWAWLWPTPLLLL